MSSTGRNIGIEHRGQTYHGSWTLVDGEVCVSSAYGSKRAPAVADHDEDLKAQAANLLAEIVEARGN